MSFRSDRARARPLPRTARRAARVLIALLAIAPAAAAAPTPLPTHSDRATSSHSFADVDYWSKIFDDPERDAWQQPQALIAALRLRPGLTVADLGAGTGYLSRYLADAVGSDGTVLAVEVEPTLVAHLRERAEREQTANVVPILASTDNPRLPAGGVDVIFIVDTYHHLDHRARYLPQLQPRAARRRPRRRRRLEARRAAARARRPTTSCRPSRSSRRCAAPASTLVENLDLLPYQYVLVFRIAEPVSR